MMYSNTATSIFYSLSTQTLYVNCCNKIFQSNFHQKNSPWDAVSKLYIMESAYFASLPRDCLERNLIFL